MPKAEQPKNTKKRSKKVVDNVGQCGNNDRSNSDFTKSGNFNAAAYIRVSTDEQAESGYGLQTQRERIEAQIAAKGWSLYRVYEDAGQSGGKLDRPALQELLNDIETGNIQAVVIYRLDRLSRKQRDTMYLLEDVFLKKGVDLVSISESLDTSSPAGRAFIGILSEFAQLERDTITERLSSGRKQKAKEGGYSGGAAPIGYKIERGGKSLYLDKEKAPAVKLAFRLNRQGLKLQQIADALNEAGHTTKRGAAFTPTQIHRILNRRDLYRGKYVYSGIVSDGQHKPLIRK